MKVLVAVLLGIFLNASNAQERVLDFHSRIAIDAKGTLSVVETIAVLSEGQAIRRGILRDFPTDYRDRLGNRVSVPLEVTRVTRNGAPENYTLERLSNGTRIRIGAAQTMLSRGRHVYEIGYRTAHQVGFFAQHDELYWNVNGNGWTFAFDNISADVALPQRVPERDLKAEAYTGAFGARGRAYEAEVREGAAMFRSTGRFAPGEGMTIVLAFPKGIVTPPTGGEKVQSFFSDNQGVLYGAGGLAAMLAFLLWRWSVVGRDPRAGPRFPRYDPPPSIGPAGARYIDRQGYDERCFAAALLGLGQRGFLKITQATGHFALTRTAQNIAFLAGEQSIARRLLPTPGERRWIRREHDPVVQEARDSFRLDLEAAYGEKLFRKNHGSLAAGIAIGVLSIAVMSMMDASGVAIVVAVLLLAASAFVFSRWLPAYSTPGRKLQDHIEGLRQYLSVAEKEDLARMKAPPQTPQEFSRLLPYAFALDVEKKWADRFVATLGAAAVAAAVSEWYTGSDGSFSASGFSDSASAMGDAVSAASTPPGSTSGSSDSGGGGGGSSGGGGGGGGGSGW